MRPSKTFPTIPPWLALTVSLTSSAACVGADSAIGVDDDVDDVATTEQALASEAYEELKNLEDYFAVPGATEVIEVGTFNASTGEFTGLVTREEIIIGPNGKPQVKLFPAKADIGAMKATTRFRVTAATTNTTLTISEIDHAGQAVNTQTRTLAPGQTVVDVEVGTASKVAWVMTSGSQSFDDALLVTRAELIAAGAFRVEAVPVAIIYSPDQPPVGTARATFAQTQSHATTLRFSNVSSTGDRSKQYLGPDAFMSKIETIATRAGQIGIPYANTIKSISDKLQGLVPSTTVTSGVEVKQSVDSSAEVRVTLAEVTAPTLMTGLGHGDQILIMRDVEIGFVLDQGDLDWVVLGAGSSQAIDVTTLQGDRALLEAGTPPSLTTFGLTLASVDSLLALDPFVDADSSIFLPSSRFFRDQDRAAINADLQLSVEVSHGEARTTATTTTTTTTTETDPGFMGLLGLADPSSHTTSLVVGRSSTETTSDSLKSTLIHSIGGQPFFYQVFYDRLFGTFVARKAVPVPAQASTDMRDAHGWGGSAAYYATIRYPDVNGDGLADVCGRGAAGVYCMLNQQANDGVMGAMTLWSGAFSDGNGWTAPEYYKTLAFPDVNGDGKADVCGRGTAGLYCGLSNGAGLGALTLWSGAFSNAAGFAAGPQYYETITYPDLNGDGKADVCGRAAGGVQCALSTGASFGAASVWAPSFSDQNAWGSTPAYWSTLRFGDVNGDGKADLCGRGGAGMYCQTSTGAGFGAISLWSSHPSNGAWLAHASRYATLQLADVNGDGKADLCGRDSDGLRCGASTGAAFGALALIGNGTLFSDAGGWTAETRYRSIVLVDANADGKADACGRDGTGVVCATSIAATGAAPAFAPATRVVDGFTDAEVGGSASSWSTLRPANAQARAGLEWCARVASGIACSKRP
jgi:hypothetical protein